MPRATAHHPDGSVICHPGFRAVSGCAGHKPGAPGVPLVYDRPDEDRAILSAKKAWWHPKDGRPEANEPELGCTIQIDGVTALRWDVVEIPAGVDGDGVPFPSRTVRQWVDVRGEAAAVAREAEDRARLAATKRKRGGAE